MNIEDQLRTYGSILDQPPAADIEMIELTPARMHEPLNRRRALWGICAATAAVLVSIAIIWPQPGHRVTTTPTTAAATTTAPTLGVGLPSRLTVIKSLPGGFAPDSIVTTDGDVWLVGGFIAGAGYQVERRDAVTGTLKATIMMPRQETAFAIAADGSGHVFVAGGGDGAVTRTSISRISTVTNHLDYTVMLPANATCSCPIAATADNVWMSGNGSTSAIALDPGTARVDSFVALPAPSTVLSVVGSTIDIGLQDGRVAVVDAASRRIAHVDAIGSSGDATGENAAGLAGRIVAISPYRATDTSWNAWVTRGDGLNLLLQPDGATTQSAYLGVAPDATVATASGDFLYFAAASALGVRSAQHNSVGFANYDEATNTFGFVVPSNDTPSANSGGFDDVVSVGGVVWVKFGDSPGGTMLIVRPQRADG